MPARLPLLIPSACLLLPASAYGQTLGQQLDALRRRGTMAEFRQLSTELAQRLRLETAGVRQQFTNELTCRFTTQSTVLVQGRSRTTTITGDAGDLASRIEPLRDDTTGLTGLRLASRDGMPVFHGVREGQRAEEVTGFTVWIGPNAPSSVVSERRSLLARYVEACRRYF